ncbi:MAG: porin [Pseudomonadota bacterium]
MTDLHKRARLICVPSRMAIVAGAMLTGGIVLAPAQAADLGGDCCTDLEERVAELEATSVRHARRQMRLVMSGHVHSSLLFWDNGEESDIYVIDNDESSTRLNLRFTGTAVPGVTVGGQIEIDFETAVGGRISENDNDDGDLNDINVRRAEWFVRSDFGTVSVGQGSTASDGAFEVSFTGSALAGVGYGLATTNIGGFRIFNKTEGVYENITWGSTGTNSDAGRTNRVRYDTPTFAGFTASAAWGEDDEWDVALRYANEFNGVRVAAAAAYRFSGDDNGSRGRPGDGPCTNGSSTGSINGEDCVEFESYGGSIALQHVPSGLHVAGGYNERTNNDFFTVGANTFEFPKFTHWWGAAGITFRATSLGTSDISIQYIQNDTDQLELSGPVANPQADQTTYRNYGIAFSQNVDSLGGATVYFSYNRHELETDAITPDQDLEAEFDQVLTGMRVRY